MRDDADRDADVSSRLDDSANPGDDTASDKSAEYAAGRDADSILGCHTECHAFDCSITACGLTVRSRADR
jgi:hypothetical protein